MKFIISFDQAEQGMFVCADGKPVFSINDVDRVSLEKTSAGLFKLSVTNKAGEERVFSRHGLDIYAKGTPASEKARRFLERTAALDAPAKPAEESSSASDPEGDEVNLDPKVAGDIRDFLWRGESEEDE